MSSAIREDFRPEIGQLRALSVLFVLLFHLKVPGFGGGFVGVDVFFVISGYLITRNILRDVRAEHFSFGSFYLRRIRRIYPALIFTVLATYLAGALWCAPLMFLDVAKEGTHALLSISNIQYWRESSQYFAAKSDELALLHCWSLSLEEQFYLIWPALLVLASRVGRVFAVVALVTVGSFAATVFIGPIEKSATFFLMPFRMFEFGCGALVLFAPRRQALQELLSAGGLLLILVSAAFLRPDTPGQEWLVLLPCIGAAATIRAGGETWISRKLRRPAVMGIGTISYSLYLCHWPIIFFGRFIFGESANSAVGVVTMLFLMMLVATGMYRLVERRFIVPVDLTAGPWRTIAKFSAFVLPVVALTHVTFASKGFAWRMPESVLAEGRLDSPSVIENAEEKAIGPVTVDLVGDSHAEMYVAGLVPLMNRTGNRVEYVGGAGCPILLGASLKSRRRETCIHSRDETLDHLKDRRLPLLFIERWESYDDASVDYEVDGQWSNESGSFLKLEDALLRTLNVLARNRRILLVGAQVPAGCEIDRPRLLQGPLHHAVPQPCPPLPRAEAERVGAAVNDMLARVQARLSDHVELLRPVDYLCETGCPVFRAGHWLYWDPTHFTLAGSLHTVGQAEAPLRDFLRRSGKPETLSNVPDRALIME